MANQIEKKYIHVGLQMTISMIDINSLIYPVVIIVSSFMMIRYIEKMSEEMTNELAREHEKNYCS